MTGLLFLCVANSSRSQMAEGLAKAEFGDRVFVQSAGSQPLSVNPLATEVMSEIGIDISGQFSKSVETVNPSTVDLVVTLCADEICPTFLGKAQHIHWPLSDPAGSLGSEQERLEKFRDVRKRITARLKDLHSTLDSLTS